MTVQDDSSLFNQERYNALSKSLRIVGYVLRFIQGCKSRIISDLSTNQLTTEELEIAEKKLIDVVQREAFPEELKALGIR